MSPEPIHLTLHDEWAQLVNRLGAQLSKEPHEVVAFALRHLDTILNLPPGEGIAIRKTEGQTDLTVQKIVEKSDVTIHCPECDHSKSRHRKVMAGRRSGYICTVGQCSCTSGP